MSSNHLNLYIVDDDMGVRQSLAMLFVARGYRVQAFDSGESFLSQLDMQQTGCLILDLRMGGISGLQVFDALIKHQSPLVVMFLSGHGDIPMAIDTTKKGAFDWLEKPVDETVLLEKVDQAMQMAQQEVAKQANKNQILSRWHALTPREVDIARQVRLGWSNKLIADDLGLSVRSVETYRAKVYDKLWVSNAAELDRLMRDIDLG